MHLFDDDVQKNKENTILLVLSFSFLLRMKGDAATFLQVLYLTQFSSIQDVSNEIYQCL